MRFIRTKCIALLLGPSGTGFLAQLTILFEALRIWADLGSRRAVIKQIAEQRSASNDVTLQYRLIVNTSYFLAIAASLIVGGLVIAFSKNLSHFLYGDSSHYSFLIFLGALLPLASICTVTSSILKGNLEYFSFTRYTLAAYGVVILVTPPLIFYFREWGAAIAMALFFLFPFAAYLILNAKKPFLHFAGSIHFAALKEQFSQGFLQIYQDSWTNLLRMAVAAWVVHELGLAQMGIYQVVITFATVYMVIPMHAMNGYVFPLIAGSQTREEINEAINESTRFLLFVLVPVVLLVMIFPEFLIYFFFSADFLPAAPILQVQLLNTLFILFSYSYSMALVAKGKLRSVYLISTLYPLSFAVLAWILFPRFQLMGIAIASGVSGFVYCVMQVAAARHYFGMSLMPKNRKLIAMTWIWVKLTFVSMHFTSHYAARAALLGFGILWFLVSSKDHERQFLRDKVTLFFRRPHLVKKPV